MAGGWQPGSLLRGLAGQQGPNEATKQQQDTDQLRATHGSAAGRVFVRRDDGDYQALLALGSRVDALEKDNADLRARIGDVPAGNPLQSQNKALGSYALALNDRQTKSEGRLDKLETDDAWLQKQVKRLDDNDLSLSGSINNATTKLTDAKTSLDGAIKVNDAQAVSIKSLSDRATTLENNWLPGKPGYKLVDDHTSRLNGHDTRIGGLEASWGDGAKIVNGHTTDIGGLKTRATNLEAAITNLKSAINSRLTALRNMNTSFYNQFAAMKERMANIISFMRTTRDDYVTGGPDGSKPGMAGTVPIVSDMSAILGDNFSDMKDEVGAMQDATSTANQNLGGLT